jgi:hypothetical protein
MYDERFICQMITIAIVRIIMAYMAWRGGKE